MTNGLLDELPLDQVGRFEKEFLEMADIRHKDLLDSVADKKELTDDVVKRLHTIVKEFMATFKTA